MNTTRTLQRIRLANLRGGPPGGDSGDQGLLRNGLTTRSHAERMSNLASAPARIRA
jgi:hypothetical protein